MGLRQPSSTKLFQLSTGNSAILYSCVILCQLKWLDIIISSIFLESYTGILFPNRNVSVCFSFVTGLKSEGKGSLYTCGRCLTISSSVCKIPTHDLLHLCAYQR